jgi:serine protease AprX
MESTAVKFTSPRPELGPSRNEAWLRVGLSVVVVVVALVATLAMATAPVRPGVTAAVRQSLLDAARNDRAGVFDVLVKGNGSTSSAKLAESVRHSSTGRVMHTFTSVNAIELKLTGSELLELARQHGVASIVANGGVVSEGLDNHQHWDENDGAKWYWGSPAAKASNGTTPTIAIVDSGVSNANDAFGGRLLAQFDLGGGSAAGDPRGHGTFVAAIAAGAGAHFAGTDPNANILSLDVFGANGTGKTSDVISAVDWILQNKDRYDIRVANFSLQTSQQSSFVNDPLDQAVERLWEAGVVVVASAGNYGTDGQPSGVTYAPGNDPFVITVGASDIVAQNDPKHDVNAPWSAYGYTLDGFAKPDLGAPGRYVTEEIPAGSTLYADYPNNQVKPGQLQLSGTSFSAPVVSGMAAALLAAHPDWTPDEVKGALMASAVPTPKAAPNSLGVGEANIQRAFALHDTPPNPNAALEQFLVADPAGGPYPIFDSASWFAAAQNDPSWNSASWSSASWSSASWSSASWSSASWSSASWSSASWSAASWSSSAESSNSMTDASETAAGDGIDPNY